MCRTASGVKNTPAKRKTPLTVWLHRVDDEALDQVLAQVHRCSRHMTALAAVRAGLRLLEDQPELVLDLLQDEPRAKHVRVRNP